METQQKVKMWLTVLLIAAPFATAGAMGSVPTQATLDVAVSHPYLSADKTQTAYLRVALTGFGLVPERWNRSPVNVAIVIDKSGSMSGEKIEKAKDAAIMAVRRLSSNDIVSVVTYDSTVNVVVPATRVSDKHNIVRMIQRIRAGGTTALFGGVSKGAREVRKFIGPERVNRIILLSDGLANVGPSSPAELGSLGASLAKEGISVTTIGLGLHYNEDLMTMLAYKSDGNHYFAEHAAELAEIFDSEFGQVLSVVAQDIDIKIKCAHGVRPVRFLGRSGRISGRTATISISNLHSNHEKFALLEVEVAPGEHRETRTLATVNASYTNMKTYTTDKLTSSVEVNFTDSSALVEKLTNSRVMVDVVKLLAAEKNDLVISLRDKGQIQEAKNVGLDNAAFLKANAVKYDSKDLYEESLMLMEISDKLESDTEYVQKRKLIREQQHRTATQQAE